MRPPNVHNSKKPLHPRLQGQQGTMTRGISCHLKEAGPAKEGQLLLETLYKEVQVERNILVAGFLPAPILLPHRLGNAAFRGHKEQSRESGGTDLRANRAGPVPSSKPFVHSSVSSETSGVCTLLQTNTPSPVQSSRLPSCSSPKASVQITNSIIHSLFKMLCFQ